MRREEFPAHRPGWEQTIDEEGLTYSIDFPGDTHYWNEYAAYVFTPDEMDSIRVQSEQIHKMCLNAVEYMASGAFGTLGLPEPAFQLAIESWNHQDPDFYGRFDFTYSGIPGDPLKLLEYNADTPTGIIEAAICQKTWYQQQRLDAQGYGHWGEIGEAFTERWRQIFAAETTPQLHLAHVNESIDPYQEDYNNVWLIAHAAQLAGVKTKLIPIDEIIFNEDTKSWSDADGKPINNLFKLYPWEDLVTDSESGYDKLLFAYHGSIRRWVEPAWKMFLSNKLLLAALWEMYPNHPNLVPAYAGRSGGLTNWVRKPIFGREGDGIEVHAPDHGIFSRDEEDEHFIHAPESEFVYQQYIPAPLYSGLMQPTNHPMLGVWMVNGRAVGMGIRESDGPVTDYYCRFAPHLVKE